MAKRPRSTGRTKKQSKRRAFSALEIARRELEGDDSASDLEASGSGKNGAILHAGKGEDADSDNASFEDEELDSDAALGSDDDYDVMNSKFSQTIRDQTKAKKKAVKYYDSEEDEGGYTSIEEDELVSLSAAWDMDDQDSGKTDSKKEDDGSKLELNDDLSDRDSSESELSSFEEEEEEDDPFSGISDDEADTELKSVANILNKDNNKKISKKLETYAMGEENEFAIPASKSGERLDISSMLAAVDDPTLASKATLLKGNLKSLSTPLPQRIQKRLERKAAYEISKDEVNKWHDSVQQLRQAEHISFPLNPEVHHNESNVFIKEQPNVQTEVESKVTEVLQSSDLVAPLKETTFEEIEVAKMTPAEMKKRTAELRLMRELMFREERKAKRIKKIKSKAYHRIKKKELLKNKALVDSDESDEDHDIARAKERMTLKHKTQGKWAKDMIKHGMTKDKDTREEMEEMLRQGERLKEKILGIHSDEESNYNDVASIERDEQNIDVETDSTNRENVGKTGVLNMAFMRKAEARERESNNDELNLLKDIEAGLNPDHSGENGHSEANKTINQGRRVYVPGTTESREEMVKSHKEVVAEVMIDESKNLVSRLNKKNSKPKAAKKSNSEESSGNSNPWLNDSDDESNIKKSSKFHVVDRDSSQLSKAANKIKKEMVKQSHKSKLNKEEDVLLDLESGNSLNIVDPYGGSDDEQSSKAMFKQQDVISEAFAGDDVVSKFEEEKRRVAIDEDDKEEDVTLPGWGDWTGAGTEGKKNKKKYIKKIKGVVEKDKRRDKSLRNVIINEKVNKKNLKYQSSAVPFPFESREQYERSLRMPLGQEWTSRTSHQKMIKPRILTKSNTVIDPLKAPFK